MILSVVAAAAELRAADDESPRMQIRLRDSRTGVAVGGEVHASRAGSRVAMTAGSSASVLSLETTAGDHFVAAHAPGHETLQTSFRLESGSELTTTLWLDPVDVPENLRPESIRERSRPGMLLMHGHIVDAETAHPIENAEVRFAGIEGSARSDAGGYFWFRVDAQSREELAATADLLVTAGEHREYVLRNVFLREGDMHVIVDMERGSGRSVHDATHQLLAPHDDSEDAESLWRSDEGPAIGTGTIGSNAVTPPSSIRVGFNCSTSTSCTSVQVYSLETYVANGLDDEWYASWHAESLKAGAVAYRSYGAYYVRFPKTANYDICSTTSCQAHNPATTSTSVQNAASATAGILIVNSSGTTPFFAEYAAEQNNGASCGNALVGRPTDNWPCMSDSVCSGQSFNGHGRGMCQWGSQRWALNQGKNWQWIVNHYYNNEGNPSGARNGVLQTGSTPSQSTINVNATNNGAAWSGQLNFNLNGPSGISGAAVPYTRTGSAGTYSVQYIGGGPSGGTFTGITPSSSQTVSSGGTITFTLNFTTPASCPDPYEPNNSSTQAYGPISAGSSYSGRICDASDVDWFGVDLAAGQTFNLSLAVPSSVDYDVELYGPNNAWATGSYGRGASVDESFSHNAATTGRYNVRIYGFQSAFRTDASYTLSFTLANAQQTLTVSKGGAGSGTVTSSPSGINCGATCSANFAANTTVTLTAAAAAGSTFGGWTGSGCSGTGTCQVTMSQARSVTATFNVNTPGPQTLSVAKSGTGSGTVTSAPSGINCGSTCSTSFAYNTSVTLSAAAGSGSTFTGWSGEGCSGTGNCQVLMSQSRNVTAAFSGSSNPAPSISSVSPVAVTAGDPDFTLTVDGSGFIADSVVRWNGSARPTTFVSSTRITALIAASDFASPGNATVTIANPAPGGGTSNGASVTIQERSSSCAATPISGCPTTIQRSLTTSGCTAGKRGSGYYTDVLSFAATAGTSIVIDLSASFDTYLYLVDPNGNVAASNDDAHGTTNSQIAATIQTAGTWTIEATTYVPGEIGPYTLSLSGCGTPLATPTGLVVTYNHALVDANTPGVDVRWNGVGGAVTYEADVNGVVFDLESSSTSVGIYGLSEPVCYAVRIRAVSGGGQRSNWTARELATSVIFSDDPLVAGVTVVKAAHANELRTAVATVRSAAGLAPFSFSGTSGAGSVIRASHVIETRNALNEALTALGRSPVLFSDPVPGVTPIRATDLQRLRDAMK